MEHRNNMDSHRAIFSRYEAARNALGFRDGLNGPHAARTIMLDDLSRLFECVPADADRAHFATQVIEANCLAKPTKVARELSLRHLAALYGLEPKMAVFRTFRKLWDRDLHARPLLALCIALARDPLLRSTQSFITSKHVGEAVYRESVEQLLADTFQDRFTPASLKSFAQNVNGTWTQAGFLRGRTPKYRTAPVVTYTGVAFCLFLGFLEGLSGQRLFASNWTKLLGCTPAELEGLTTTAFHHGLLVFLNAGGVKEIRFPGYLTAQEEEWRLEVSHV